MTSQRLRVSRRAMLRGVAYGSAVSLGLPLLESMLNDNGTALAAGSPLPVRYGLYFWGNGLPWSVRHRGAVDPLFRNPISDDMQDLYTPTTEGKGFAVTEVLRPLQRHLSNVNVVTGLEPKTDIPDSPTLLSDGHMRGICVALTGDMINPVGFDHETHTFAVNRMTLDQYIARHPQFYRDDVTLYRSVEIGVSRAVLHEFGTWMCVSHNGPNSLNPAQHDPQRLFQQLFAMGPGMTEVGRRTRVLDAVASDLNRLSQRLGKRDRERLDEHLDHINEIERRLHTSHTACTPPSAPTDSFEGEPRVLQKLDVLADILVAALRCDLTRVFTLAFTTGGGLMQVNPAGEIEGGGAIPMHPAAHAGEREICTAFAKLNLEGYALLLDKLAAERDVNGKTLLDSSVIMGTSEYGEGYTHSNKEHPFIIAGSAGGRLDTGWHVRDENGNMARAHLTVLRALGLDDASFGFNGGESSDPLPFLKA